MRGVILSLRGRRILRAAHGRRGRGIAAARKVPLPACAKVRANRAVFLMADG